MKFIKFLVAAAAISVFSFGASAQTSQGDSMDTGKGGFKISVSFTKPLDGPFDFAKNKGPKINTINGNTYGEMAFAGNRSNTSFAFYKYAVFRDDRANERNKPYTAEALAQERLEAAGFKGKGKAFKCPSPRTEGSTMVCYMASGTPVFGVNKPKNDLRLALYVIAVSFKSNTTGYVISGEVFENDTSKFDLDPSDTEQGAYKVTAAAWNHHSIDWN